MTSNNTPADVREAAAKIALSWTPVDGHAVEQHPLESPCGWIRRCIAAAIRNMPLPPVKQSLTTDASIGSQSTVEFVQEWMMSGDYEADDWTKQFAAAIDARASNGSHVEDEDILTHADRMAARYLMQFHAAGRLNEDEATRIIGKRRHAAVQAAMPLPDGGKLREALRELWSIVHGCDLRLSVPPSTIAKVREALADQTGKASQLEPIDTVPGAGEGSL